jgi:hypothetical protein
MRQTQDFKKSNLFFDGCFGLGVKWDDLLNLGGRGGLSVGGAEGIVLSDGYENYFITHCKYYGSQHRIV